MISPQITSSSPALTGDQYANFKRDQKTQVAGQPANQRDSYTPPNNSSSVSNNNSGNIWGQIVGLVASLLIGKYSLDKAEDIAEAGAPQVNINSHNTANYQETAPGSSNTTYDYGTAATGENKPAYLDNKPPTETNTYAEAETDEIKEPDKDKKKSGLGKIIMGAIGGLLLANIFGGGDKGSSNTTDKSIPEALPLEYA